MAEARRFDDNLLLEILARLPAKALGRLKLTSKRWEALISDPRLITIQAQRSTQNVLGILNVTADPLGGELIYFPLEHSAHEAPDTSFGLPSPQTQRISLKCACNGLLFIELFNPDCHLVCNPTTKYLRQLPYLNFPKLDTKFGLAFDPAISPTSFKVVASTRVVQQGQNDFYRFYVYSAEANTWRVSNATIPCTRRHNFNSVASVFFNGGLHWLMEKGDMLAFNVEQEVAYNMALPEGLRPAAIAGYSSIWLGVAAGHMSLVKFDKEDILVWTVEDYGNRRREFKHRIEAQGTGYYRKNVPIFYDGKKCVLFTWRRQRGESGLAVYRIQSRQWDKIRKLKGWMDWCRHFVPCISHMVG